MGAETRGTRPVRSSRDGVALGEGPGGGPWTIVARVGVERWSKSLGTGERSNCRTLVTIGKNIDGDRTEQEREESEKIQGLPVWIPERRIHLDVGRVAGP